MTVGLLELRPVGVISVLSVVFKPRPMPTGLEGDLFNVRTCWAFSRELVTVLGSVELVRQVRLAGE